MWVLLFVTKDAAKWCQSACAHSYTMLKSDCFVFCVWLNKDKTAEKKDSMTILLNDQVDSVMNSVSEVKEN